MGVLSLLPQNMATPFRFNSFFCASGQKTGILTGSMSAPADSLVKTGDGFAAPRRVALDGRDVGVFLGLLAAVLLAYCCVWTMQYAYLDDYFWLDLSRRSPADLFGPQIVQGRPLNGLILQQVFSHAGTISGLTRVRALILVETAAFGWMLYRALRNAGWHWIEAALLGALACFLPAIQVYVSWADSVAVPLSAIAACAAAMLTGHALDKLQKRSWMLVAAASLMLVSATIYQPTAMLFWPVAAIDLLGKRERQNRPWLRLAAYLAVAAVALLFAWGVFKYGLAHVSKRPSPKRSGFTHDPLGKFYWFNAHPVIDSLNLFNIRPNYAVAAVVAALLIAGLTLRLYKTEHKWVGLVAIVALVPLSYLPNLLAQESWSSYRTQIGLSSLVLVLAGLSLRQLIAAPTARIASLTIATIIFGAMAGHQVRALVAYPQSMELAQLRKALSASDIASAQRFFMIEPGPVSIYAPYSRYDEFGRTSMSSFWVPQAAVNLVMEELYPGHAVVPVDLPPDAPTPGATILDMRQPWDAMSLPLAPTPQDHVPSQPADQGKAG